MMQLVAIYWTAVTIYGAGYTARNFWDALLDWHWTKSREKRASVLIAAYTPLKTHGSLLLLHVGFALVGLATIFFPSPTAQAPPASIAEYVGTAIFVALPHVLIFMSWSIRRDRSREVDAARRGD